MSAWKKIELSAIKRRKFLFKRLDPSQEVIRKLIRQALKEAKKNKGHYSSFELMVPEQHLGNGLDSMINGAKSYHAEIANWIEQALEWAYRISEGESWKSLCNEPDDSEFFRVIFWKDDEVAFIGDGCNYCIRPQTSILTDFFAANELCYGCSVPLLVKRA